MSFPKYKDLDSFTNIIDIDQEIYVLQKNLFDLKLKRVTSQVIQPHLFTKAKRRLAQLQFKKLSLTKLKN